MSADYSILMVCTGNICRSPLAEQLLNNHFPDITGITVTSAGTQAMVGEPMFTTTQEIAGIYGVDDVDSHRARQLDQTLLESADLVLTMTRDHRRTVVELSPRVIRRTFTIREFARLAEATSDDTLAAELEFAGDSPAEKLQAAVQAVPLARSVLPPANDPAEDDVIDPYRQSDQVHRTSAEQLVPAVNTVASFLWRALEGGR